MRLSFCATGTTASALQAPLGEGEQALAEADDQKSFFWHAPQGHPTLSIIALHLQLLNADLIQVCPSMQKINNIIYKGQKYIFHKSEPIFLMWDLCLN